MNAVENKPNKNVFQPDKGFSWRAFKLHKVKF